MFSIESPGLTMAKSLERLASRTHPSMFGPKATRLDAGAGPSAGPVRLTMPFAPLWDGGFASIFSGRDPDT